VIKIFLLFKGISNMWYRVEVFVQFKKGVRNNEGIAIKKALHSLGHTEVSNFNIGKYMEFHLKAENWDSACKEVDEMCDKLLANPVIESYERDIKEFK